MAHVQMGMQMALVAAGEEWGISFHHLAVFRTILASRMVLLAAGRPKMDFCLLGINIS